MEVVPVFCEKGEVWSNFSIGVPTEENWGEETWMDRVVHIPEYNGYSVAIEVRDFSRSDLQIFRLAGMLELPELQSFT